MEMVGLVSESPSIAGKWWGGTSLWLLPAKRFLSLPSCWRSLGASGWYYHIHCHRYWSVNAHARQARAVPGGLLPASPAAVLHCSVWVSGANTGGQNGAMGARLFLLSQLLWTLLNQRVCLTLPSPPEFLPRNLWEVPFIVHQGSDPRGLICSLW